MKEQYDIDKLIRASLDPYRPAPDPSGKRRFLEEALGNPSGPAMHRWHWFPIGLVLLALTGLLLYIFLPGHDASSLAEDNASHASAPLAAIEAEPIMKISGDQTADPLDEMIVRGKSTLNGSTENLPTGQPGSGKNLVSSLPFSALELQNEQSSAFNVTVLATITQPEEITDAQLSATDSLTEINPTEPDDHPYVQRKADFTYIIYYKPEILFNIIDNNKLINGFGAEWQIRPGSSGFIARTGLGLSISKGYNEYQVNYNNYLGSYMQLDSVTFILAENNYHLAPVIHQSEQQVYDTAVDALPAKVYQTYLYLQVPLMLGYDVYSNEKLSFGLRAGAVFSLLLNNKSAGVNYNLGEDQFVSMDRLTPARRDMIWQLTGGVNFTIRGPKRLFVEMEPQASYYFKAMHQENEGSRQPYSVGLRIAAGVRR